MVLALDRAAEFHKAPPPGQAHSVKVSDPEEQGRSAVYRHWRFEEDLCVTLDPSVRTLHDIFEQTANRSPRNRFLGRRVYDPATKTFGKYVWEDYQTVQRRRANLGIGLVELHNQLGITGIQYGVGLWCQNRPEWQIVGRFLKNNNIYRHFC